MQQYNKKNVEKKKPTTKEEEQSELYFISEKPIKVENEYTVMFHGNVEHSYEYIDLLHLFQHASENDQIVIYWSSNGGYLYTTEILLNAMDNCKAPITGIITSTIASACTFLALNCDQIIVEKFSEMMCHNYSGGAIGKGGDIKARVESSEKCMNRLIDKFYTGFLTDEEIKDLKKGQDYYFKTEEIEERLGNRIQYLTDLKQAREAELEAAEKEEVKATKAKAKKPRTTTKKKSTTTKKKVNK